MECLRTPTGSLSLPPRPKARMSTRMVYALCFSPATTSVLHGGLFYHDNQPCFYCLKSHHATERGDDFSPVNVDCHATLHGLMTDARDGHGRFANELRVAQPRSEPRQLARACGARAARRDSRGCAGAALPHFSASSFARIARLELFERGIAHLARLCRA